MDFLRTFFGLKSSSEPPKFPENDDKNGSNGHPYFSPFTFSFFDELNSEFGQSPSVDRGNSYQEYGFMDSFQQIEQMMGMLQRVMSDFDFKEPDGYPPLMPSPSNSPDASQNLTPRDRFLKTPDSHLPSSPQNENDSECPGDSSVVRRPHEFYPDALHDHSSFSGFGFGSIFRMMDELMKPFSTNDFLRPGDGFPSGPELHPQAPREALLKQDQDLDKRPVQELLKEGPGFSGVYPEHGQTQPSVQPPTLRSNFTSTSISRTLRSDGVIEERRTYRDSSGREEVTVTEVDPATAQSLVPNPFSEDGGGFHSFFGKFF
ncbi:hypothetical protein FHG87_018313 [Trinorchestia longiramus]|nr:hypothetical protein FHG87_018313 [Trinorchestia longiramus]